MTLYDMLFSDIVKLKACKVVEINVLAHDIHQVTNSLLRRASYLVESDLFYWVLDQML